MDDPNDYGRLHQRKLWLSFHLIQNQSQKRVKAYLSTWRWLPSYILSNLPSPGELPWFCNDILPTYIRQPLYQLLYKYVNDIRKRRNRYGRIRRAILHCYLSCRRLISIHKALVSYCPTKCRDRAFPFVRSYVYKYPFDQRSQTRQNNQTNIYSKNRCINIIQTWISALE